MLESGAWDCRCGHLRLARLGRRPRVFVAWGGGGGGGRGSFKRALGVDQSFFAFGVLVFGLLFWFVFGCWFVLVCFWASLFGCLCSFFFSGLQKRSQLAATRVTHHHGT